MEDTSYREPGFLADISCCNEIIKKAADLALEFTRYCVEHNIPPDAEICGVAWNAHYIREQEYLAGKNFEKERIKSILGL